MRRTLRDSLFAAWIVTVLLAATMATSCSAPSDRVALDTLQTLKVTVDAAMRTANTFYEAGKLPEATVRQLAKDYDLFIASETVATSALGAIASSGQPVTQAAVDQIMEKPNAAAAKITGVVNGVK